MENKEGNTDIKSRMQSIREFMLPVAIVWLVAVSWSFLTRHIL